MMSGPATDWKTTVAFRALMEASSRITGGLFVLGALLMPALSVGQLPPEIMVDRYLLKAEQSIREGDCAGSRDAMETMERVLSLQEKHGLKPAPEDHFRYAKVWHASGSPERALESLVRYLQLRGRQAEHYIEALELMNRAEADKAKAKAKAGPEAPDGVYSVGGNVAAPVPIYQPWPPYSEEARKAKYQGTVVLLIGVDQKGNVRDVQVSKPLGLGLDEKAVETVRTWKFRPAMRYNCPVAVRVSVEVAFRLY